MDLCLLQEELNTWLNHNFPDTTSDKQLKGVMEELGELCHADLKSDQGIRGYTPKKTRAETMDAIGDLVIYLINYCNKKEISFKECIFMAKDTIMKRDWVKNPTNGEVPVEQLKCCLCGKNTAGRQRPNLLKGQGICTDCYSWLELAGIEKHLIGTYGDKGYHFGIKGV